MVEGFSDGKHSFLPRLLDYEEALQNWARVLSEQLWPQAGGQV